jgi:hypothetical protein
MTKSLHFWNGMPSRTVYILISGKAGVGKSAFGELIAQNISDLTVLTANFADSVKSTARKYFGWDGKKDAKGRKLLQNIGSVGREYDEYIWAKNLVRKVNETAMFPPDVAIVSDWRFPNELNYLEEENYQTITIRIVAPSREILKGTPYYRDSSETALDSVKEYDYVVDNDSITYEELKAQAKKIIKELFPK